MEDTMTDDQPHSHPAWSVLERPDGTLIVAKVLCDEPIHAAALTTHAQRVLQQLVQTGEAGDAPVTRALDAACFEIGLSAGDASTAIQRELDALALTAVAPKADSIRKKTLRERARRGLAHEKWLRCDRGGRRSRRVTPSDTDPEETTE
jgi:hypothetical protein